VKILVVAAVSIDGFIGHNLNERLYLSSQEDLDQVMKLRANCDAILVGAKTIRKDNSALVTREELFIQQRRNLNKCDDPIKVTLTKTGDIPLNSDFILLGNCRKIVYASSSIDKVKEKALSEVVTLKKFNEVNLTANQIISDLAKEGVETLIVEGGSQILTMFFEENVVNELRLSIAPFFVGESIAPRLVNFGNFYFNRNNRMKLIKVESLGGTAVMHYQLNKY
jgi:riboflavin-specific deaminase-like protein